MPSRVILNIGSVVGYSNNLKQATQWMKLGVNTDVNPGTKKASLHLMDGADSVFTPSPTFLPVDFRLLNRGPRIVPTVVPTATTSAMGHLYFLKISLILSLKGFCASLSATCGSNLSSSSLRSATLAWAASLSEGEVSSFSNTCFSSSL